jgi:RES domain-containing protein
VAEYQQDIGIRPGTFCAHDGRVERILDLTRPAVRTAFGVDPGDLTAPGKTIFLVRHGTPPSWTIAERLAGPGAQGIRVPSVQVRTGIDLVPGHSADTPECRLTAMDPQSDLPRDQASWSR